MPLWIVSSAGSGSATHWNQPPSSSRFTRSRAAVDLHVHDDRRVRHAEPLGEHDADLPEALIVGLQAGEHEVELLVLDCRGERVGDRRGVGRGQRVGLDVDRAIGAAGERLTNHLRRARRAGGADHDLAAVLLLEPQRLLERVRVGLVQLEAGVGVADPRLRPR